MTEADPLLFYNGKIEEELEKPVEEQNQAKLTFWRSELDKLHSTSTLTGNPTSNIHSFLFIMI